ncbi:peptidase M50 [Methanothermus fervidus DSM 2088]|uniref:Peptidase M50 n=1 Tax=Methanothermus fervidus (strain ATCC 43054 / DSM 2088 / JCM 10308 / V24 S) TaxID=523846 RepID=E3GY26_METFV|nr:site-2 protease family protein [Methanothermus fervidus]ADP77208.1 peptidase M50 [Methanothermus fervidus DSM 2088]
MDALHFYLIFFLIVWTFGIIFRDKLKIEIHGLLMMRKTKRMREFIDRIAKRHKKFWKWYMNVGIVVAFITMVVTTVFLFYSLKTVFKKPAVSVVVPGVDMPGSQIYVPLGYGIIALVTVLVVHELAHGILARVEGVRIKSIGVMLLAILPGAFVEPDENDMKKAKRISKLRIYAAGSVANITLALICLAIAFLIGNFIIPAALHPDGMKITDVVPGSPASKVLKSGMVIHAINDHPTNNFSSYFAVVSKLKPGEKIKIQTDKGTYTLVTAHKPEDPKRGYMGIRSMENYVPKKGLESYAPLFSFLLEFSILLSWIQILNLGIGSFNLLPIKPLDGGLMFEELLKHLNISKDVAKSITNCIGIILVLIVLINITFSIGKGIIF